MTWRYRLEYEFRAYAPELSVIEFHNQWLFIDRGNVVISRGYAWDGCSPAWRMPGGLWIGPWDGPRGTDGRPVSWHASLVHDALCQFRPDLVGVSKDATVRIFKRMLVEAGAPGWMCSIYPWAVDYFGPQNWRLHAG